MYVHPEQEDGCSKELFDQFAARIKNSSKEDLILEAVGLILGKLDGRTNMFSGEMLNEIFERRVRPVGLKTGK